MLLELNPLLMMVLAMLMFGSVLCFARIQGVRMRPARLPVRVRDDSRR